jgi:glycosyltransferase involved in cell wall biosynthesis
MQKILMAVTNDTLTDIRLRKTAKVLSEKGFEILLIGRKSRSTIKPDSSFALKQFSVLFDSGPFFYLCFNFRLFLYLLFQRKINSIWSNDLDTLPACALASFFRQKPLVYDSHELFTEVPELQKRPVVRRIWTLAESLFIKRAKVMITVCDSIAYYYHEKYDVNPIVIRNLPERISIVSNNRKVLNLPSDKKIVVYQGAVNLGRGVEELIKAVEFLPDVFLLIIGTGDLFKTIENQVKATDYSNRILLTGRLPYAEMIKYTQTADLGVSLEKSFGLNYHFALPNKLFDYIQAGIPVLVSALPEMERVVKQYGVGELCHSHEPMLIAQSVEHILQKPKGFYKGDLQAAADELNWESEKKKLDRVLASL